MAEETLKYSGVLSDRDIKREIAAGNIILYDPDRDCSENIQNCSVDVTLGPYYYHNEAPISIFNPWKQDHVNSYWGKVQEAETIDVNETRDLSDIGLEKGDQFIWMEPGESILGHTREFIGGVNHITTMMKARSSLGRCNVTVCRDAGWGDIGYYNRYTLEITNNGTSPIVLPVGARIAQIIFFYTGVPDTIYKGKYQSGNNLQEVVANWHPNMMLPKLYLDNISKSSSKKINKP